MRRLLFAVGLLGALLLLVAEPAWSVSAGDPCSAGDAAAGTITTTSDGTSVKCVADSKGQPRWTAAVGGTTGTTAAGSTVTTTATTIGASATATTVPGAGLAGTGLKHSDQYIEAAILLLALGAAIVLELRARQGLDRLRVQRLIAQLPGPSRRSTRNEPH